jgi:probable HAF family extracellular repeat protein
MSKSALRTLPWRAAAALGALALMLSACSPDVVAPASAARLAGPYAERISDIALTTIIPPNLGYGPRDTGSVTGRALAINDAGVVVGSLETFATGYSGAFTWKDGVMTHLGTSFIPVAINRSGEIAGYEGGDYSPEAVVWKDGVLTPLGAFFATDMNDDGQVVGYRRLADNTTRAVIWQNGALTDLGTLGGGSAVAEGINKHRQVVGWSSTGDNVTHAFVWEDGVMTDLGTLGGPQSAAYAINDLGEVVGVSRTAERPWAWQDESGRPFIWRRGVMTRITLEQGSTDTDCYRINDVNNAGLVVGARGAGCGGVWHAFAWRDGVDVELPPYAPLIETQAAAVNSSGEIVGYSIAGRYGAFLWNVPRYLP